MHQLIQKHIGGKWITPGLKVKINGSLMLMEALSPVQFTVDSRHEEHLIRYKK